MLQPLRVEGHSRRLDKDNFKGNALGKSSYCLGRRLVSIKVS
jgi:hypothetical protein